MFKQLARLFKSPSSGDQRTTQILNAQPQIYAIPTISSSFETTSSTINNNFKFESSSSGASSHCSSASLTSIGFNKGKTEDGDRVRCNRSNMGVSTNFNDMNTRQIYIAPHCIRYSNSTLDDTIYRIDDESLNEIAAEILESENLPPKLQIVYYDANYFAINNSNLQIYKQLELSGLITHVQADLISVEAIPYALRQHLLQTPSHLATNSNEISDEDCYQEVLDNSMLSNQTNNNSPNESIITHNTDTDNVADVIIQDDEGFGKHMLVDETYEFGACENCLDSDEESRCDEKLKTNETKACSSLKEYDLNTKIDIVLKKHQVEKSKRSAGKSTVQAEPVNEKITYFDDHLIRINLPLNIELNKLGKEEDFLTNLYPHNDEEFETFVKREDITKTQHKSLNLNKKDLKKGVAMLEIENLLITNENEDY